MVWSGGNGVIKAVQHISRIIPHLPDECVKIGGGAHLTHTHPILNARDTQTQVVLETWNEVVGNFIVRVATVEAIMCRLRRDAPKRLRRMALQLRLAEETI